MTTTKNRPLSKVSEEEERISFDHLPSILSSLQKDVSELKNYIVRGKEGTSEPDEWMDVQGLRAYHPDHPAIRTIYDWIHYKRVPYHKDGKRIRFKKSEIDEWLSGGYHRTDNELLEDTFDILNARDNGVQK